MKAKSKPKISVVMAAYNAEEYLHEAIDSILTQSLKDFEFIIINDGSTDKTSDIIHTYAKRDPRIRVVTQKANQGLVTALNTGFRMAKGKYIARMDADDISLRERFFEQFSYLEKHPETVILGTLSASMDKDGNIYDIQPLLLNDREIRLELAIRNRQFRHGSVMIRRDTVAQNKEYYSFNAAHFEDYEYWSRLLRHGEASNLAQVLYYYRRSGASITAKQRPAMFAGSKQIRASELLRLDLPHLSINDITNILGESRNYVPEFIILGERKLPTHLRRHYQYYLIAIGRIYIARRNYLSSIVCLATAVFINPFDLVYHSLGMTLLRIRQFFGYAKYN